jgi:hypothetical protein
VKYLVNENGVTREETASPEMEAIFARQRAFNELHPDFWCSCDKSEVGTIHPRGHSVDVDRNCGGWIQIG